MPLKNEWLIEAGKLGWLRKLQNEKEDRKRQFRTPRCQCARNNTLCPWARQLYRIWSQHSLGIRALFVSSGITLRWTSALKQTLDVVRLPWLLPTHCTPAFVPPGVERPERKFCNTPRSNAVVKNCINSTSTQLGGLDRENFYTLHFSFYFISVQFSVTSTTVLSPTTSKTLSRFPCTVFTPTPPNRWLVCLCTVFFVPCTVCAVSPNHILQT